MIGGDASPPATLATHISSWGFLCLTRWPVWVPSLSPKQTGQTYTHIYTYKYIKPLYTNTSRPTRASIPALPCPTGDAAWPWLLAQGSAWGDGIVYCLMLACSGYTSFPPPWTSPHLPCPSPAPPPHADWHPWLYFSTRDRLFPCQRFMVLFSSLSASQISRAGSCSVCLGRRCVATNYF